MKLPNRERLLLTVALSAVGILLADRWILGRLGNLWAERSEKIRTLQQSIARGRHLLNRETAITRRWEDMWQTALSQDTSSAEDIVIKAAHRWRNESRATFTTFTGQQGNEYSSYKTYNCQAETVGDLEAIVRFLYEMEADPLPIRAESVEIKSRDDTGSKLTLTLRFSGLQLTEDNQ